MTSEYVIEKGVVPPNPNFARNGKYPWNLMKVGDSFAAPVDKRSSLINSAANQKRRNGWEFMIRTIDKTTVRVWRTK